MTDQTDELAGLRQATEIRDMIAAGADMGSALSAMDDVVAALRALRAERDEARAGCETVCDSYVVENQQLSDRATVAEATLATQAKEIAALREALEPFARQANTHNEQFPDAMFVDDYERDKSKPWVSFAQITLGDLRRARSTLASLEPKETDARSLSHADHERKE